MILTAPVRAAAPGRPTRTASGSVAVHGAKARVAWASRIFVEGRHDAELVEKVWGDDLRIEGVVVEFLGGVDDLADHLLRPGPGARRRAGRPLVKGSKESRIAHNIARSPIGKDVLIVGHLFIDVWQAVKPARLGIARWPDVPATSTGRPAPANSSAGRTGTRRTSPGRGRPRQGVVVQRFDPPLPARRGAHRLRDELSPAPGTRVIRGQAAERRRPRRPATGGSHD